jgi:Ca-activated chloride channel family protein
LVASLVCSVIRLTGAQTLPEQPTPKLPPPRKVHQQIRAQQDADAPLPKSGADLVRLDVTVVDKNNAPVFDLSKDDFTVYEDNVKQTIETVSREEAPISFGLVVDTSGSMRSKLQTVTESALPLVKQMRPDDEAFVASFKREPELVQDFTSDKRKLEDALGELYTSGDTALLDAIIATADYAREKGKQWRKALVVFTDGSEKSSSVKEKEVREAVEEDDAQVYFIGFIDEEEKKSRRLFGKPPARKARELLTRLARDYGGRAFFPKDVSETPAIAAQIIQELRMRYVVSYYPSNDKRDGKFREVNVIVSPKGNRKLIVRCSRGYYAPEDSGGDIEPMTASLKPTILHKEKPKYTLEAYGHNVQGEVVLSAVFAGDGRITGIRVVCGLPHGLTENAIAAAKKIRFKPAARNGAPVSVRATLIYTFRIL